jgi:cell pole-organizing protein PopZ
MRKPEQAPEPSIEEILASIRRIIADDAPVGPASEEPTRLQVHSGTPRPGPAGGRRDDEVLELTEDFMLAEEASAVRLQEPEEPAEFTPNNVHRDPFGENVDPFAEDHGSDPFARRHGDPYENMGAPGATHPIEAAVASTPEPEAPRNAARSGLASVMAEVQRFVDVGKVPEEAPKPAARPLESWTQPANEVFKSDPAPRPPSRWSARQKSPDGGKGPEQPLPGRSPGARDQEPPRKAGLSSHDWSQGIQMPVPDEGPGMPFVAEETLELPQPAPPPPAPTAEWNVPEPQVAEAAGAAPAPFPSLETPRPPVVGIAEAPQPAASADLQQRAEKLADRAVSDFADDKLESLPIAKFLKSDKPLMEVITGTLVNALARVGGSSAEPEEPASLPIEDLVEESAAPDLPPPASMDEPVARDLRRKIPNLDGGFMAPSPLAPEPAPRPAAPQASRAAVIPDQEPLELPREEIEDMVAMPHPEQLDSVAPHQPTGIAEQPVMPQVPAPPGRMMSRPPSAVGPVDFQALEATLPGGPKTLEETVREMLRPLLAQWLNENMPRIVNDAIREEIAAMGMKLPRRD